MNGRLPGRIMLLLVLLAVSAGITSCGQLTDTAEAGYTGKKEIALIVKSKNSDYWKAVISGAEAAEKELGVDVLVEAPESEQDIQGQIGLISDVINYKRSALVLAPSDDMAPADAVARAAANNIPVITIDSRLDSPKPLSYIGVNHYEAGEKAGRKLAELLGDQGRAAVVGFKPDGQAAAERERGFLDEMARHPKIQVVEKTYCYADPDQCGEGVRRLAHVLNTPTGIAVLHGASTRGVVEEIVKEGLEGRVKVVTMDSTPEDIEYLQEGIVQATIIQNPFSMGYLGVQYAVDALEGRRVKENFFTDTKVIDQVNMFWSDNQKLLFPFVK
ncbi:substrate-binding domain-containing protein [Paenibacillus mucilaginosus]|uniref:ABC transporter substrate-binding protein n=3 Tax=Paenibacillus mucilaginosus TaxID=61624 RepID=I0BT09_9BACL|nr:substrate-binding domain-containing protein [Paenibacillus mucilaginosus]AEI45491.1 putative ABC transporter substrate binding protein [Paenibacillus mucilaginosus KNP414]AFC33195.1 putative ABC transporter substrate binding protein [Paenibacillus mucilaginosus 3016]AFH65506.1 ABC transporter substrate-binding protein [Paenibacillus mucilaginosus K02]MCG7215247.1 substrate-binding domain-containing protein [Paenibacillus mucilaginosus]WDM26915.1 substrate-binding domain-containing protein [